MKNTSHPIVHLCWAALIGSLIVVTADAAVEVIGVQYQQDNPYSQYNCYYHYGNYPTSCGISVTGSFAHVFLKNTGSSSVTMNYMTLAGYNLNTIIKEEEFNDHFPASIYLYWDDPPADIMAAGEPVWCRMDPNPISAYGVARAVIRLRAVPTTVPIAVGVNTSAGTVTTNIAINASDPVVASVGFSTNRMRVYLHWRRSGGTAPTSVYLDGTNVTSLTTTVSSTNVNFAVSVINLTNALPNMSYHVFQGVYADGKKATASLRVWINRFLYGTWGVKEIPDNDDAAAEAWIDECQHHGVNCYVNNSSGGLQDFMATQAGRDYAEAHDYGYVKDDNGWGTNPRMWFIDDEPDLEEGTVEANFCGTGLKIPCGTGHTAGILGRHLLAYGETLRAFNSSAPTTINVDGNFKPDGWYAYGQHADVMMMDSYYEQEQAGQYWDRPAGAAIFNKATSIYAAAIATTTAAEPNPMHMILYSCEYKHDEGEIWPFPSPTSKRIQVYYALAGGAKGLAYWWYKSGYPFNGLAADTAASRALWKEIGVLGNEIKTAQPLLVISHPVTTTIGVNNTNIFARTLAADTNALVLIVVNDNYKNDLLGCHITNIANATVTNTLPSWLVDINKTTAFEINASGTKDVAATLSGSQLIVNLGTLTVTRMIVITTDSQLRSAIQSRYDSLVKSHVCGLAPELCDPPGPCLKNPGAEDGFYLASGSYIANNWAEFEGAYGTNVVCYDETASTNRHSGSHSQRVRVWGTGGASGGVYQQMGATDGSNYTITCWMKAYDTASRCYLGVDPTGGTSPTGGNVVWSSVHTNTTWVQKSLNVTASGGSGRLTVFYKVTSVDNNKRNGYFDDVTPFCAAGPTITLQPAATNLCAGGTASFKVGATGQGTLVYQWKKDGVDIFDGGHYSGAATTNLVVTTVDSSDAASYSAAVTDANGTTNSSAATLTVRPATGFTQHPANVNVCSGADVQFGVVAVGDGTITYQWQTNGVNISNNSHYSGCTTATLTVSNVVAADAVYYRCVATAGCGNSTSFQGLLTLTTNCAPNSLTNGDFEGGNTSGVGTGWTGYQRAPNPTTVWSIQTASPPEGLQYQQIANSSSTGGGGVRQDVTGCSVGCTYTIAGWMRGNSTNAFCTVKCSPTASTDWSTAVNLTPAQTYSGSSWTAFAGTVVATGTNMTIWLDGQTGGTGQFNAECFDGITVTCGTIPPPTITQQPSAQNVCAGANVNFSITATGQGTLTYQWQKNQVNLSNGGHYSGVTTATLTITGTDATDAANYRCVVSNAGGSVNSSEAALTVRAATTITGQPSAQNVCSGATANFSVTATGDGTLTYQWQKNQVNLSNGGHYSGVTTATLTITGADATDAANYRCVVTGGCGSANSSEAALTIKAATQITGQPSAQNVCPGATANFSVSATGDGTLTYQWQKNQVNLSNGGHYSGVTTATLTIAGADGTDAANYRCVVTGGCGSANSSEAALTVKAATSITSQPSAQNVCPGVNTSFSVTATGDGTITYQWQTNGVNLSNNSKYAGCTSATLWVTNVSSADAVDYRCVVTAGCGSVNSSTAALTVKAATSITGQPSAQNVCSGATVNFSVTATGDGTLTYQWQKNQANLSNGGHYSGVTTATLTITGADATDAANYRCVVTGGCGSANSSEAALTIRAATTITTQPSARNVCAGTTTNFTVAATGDGTITYQWQTNSVNISNNSKYAGCTTATLWVTNVAAADAVNYRCVVTAGCGSVNSSTAALTLRAATAITSQPVSRMVATGGTTNFSVTATGDGTLTYQWQKYSTNISNGGHYSGCTTATLTISSASSADAAPYRCVVTGGCGSVTSSNATLTVCPVPTLLNPSFELSNVSGVATNWTGYQRSPNPTTVWSIQTASPPAGTGTNYQQIANTSSTGGGGVRQDIKNCVIGARYTIAGWMRGNSTLYSTCTVKVSPTASTTWTTAINLSPAATFTGATWTNFSGTVTATGTNMTLWLDGQTGSTGLNKAECFDGITVTCTP